MQSEFQKIFQEIQADPDNESFTKQGIKPLYYASSSARINIIGQADSLGDEFHLNSTVTPLTLPFVIDGLD